MDRNPHQKIIIFRIMILIGAIHLYIIGKTSPIENETKSLISNCLNGQYRIVAQELPGNST